MEKEIFGDYALKYFERGYNVLPLEVGAKKPFQSGWQRWCENKQQTYEVESWAGTYKYNNIGLPLGRASNVIALDFDHNVDGLHEKISAILPPLFVKKSGQKGFTAFFRYNGEVPKKWYKDEKAVLELLSSGNQTVLPPSIHPDTKKPYIWTTLDTLEFICADELPCLPDNFISEVDNLLGYKQKLAVYNNYYSDAELPEISEIEKALSFIPANEYAIWLAVGMALHHAYGAAGFAPWDNWSRKSPKYEDKGMTSKWASFGRGSNVVSIGTIFHYAISYGYMPQPPEIPTYDFEIIIEENRQLVGNIDNNGDDGFPIALLEAPGLPGEIAHWINSTAIMRQPILALGAAISAAGTIFSQKIQSDSALRTNFLTLGVAASATGKNHALECIKSLFTICQLEQYISGKFTSDTALFNTLHETNGINLSLMDEIGREIKCLNSGRAGSHETRLMTLIMELYSAANNIYHGKRFALTEAPKTLVEPCLNIYGTTTPKRFYDSLSSDDAIDGFLARWLLFESKDANPLRQVRGDIRIPPQELIDNIKFATGLKGERDIVQDSVFPRPNPKTIHFTDGAQEILNNFSEITNNNRLAEEKKGAGLDAIWGRTREHAIKIALVAHPYRHGVIEIITMDWACKLATYLSHAAIKVVRENIADSEYEKNLNRIYTAIKRFNDSHDSAMPFGKLTNAIRTLKMQEIQQMLQHLEASGRIMRNEVAYNGKISYHFNAL